MENNPSRENAVPVTWLKRAPIHSRRTGCVIDRGTVAGGIVTNQSDGKVMIHAVRRCLGIYTHSKVDATERVTIPMTLLRKRTQHEGVL